VFILWDGVDVKTTWVMGSVKPEYFALMLRFLPNEQFSGVSKVHVIVPPDKIDTYTELCAYRCAWKWDVVNEEEFYDAVPKRIKQPLPLREYPLKLKVLSPLVHTGKPFIWTDDDIVVHQDFSHLLGDVPWGGAGGLDFLRDPELMDALRKIKPRLSQTQFNKKRMDAGVWYLPKTDKHEYATALTAFFDHPRAHALHARVGRVGRWVNPYRLLDQRFLTAWILAHGGHHVRAPVYRMCSQVKLPKLPGLKDGVFTHYAASGGKPMYVKWLHQRAEELGIPRLGEMP
jgi:hypothetical protein